MKKKLKDIWMMGWYGGIFPTLLGIAIALLMVLCNVKCNAQFFEFIKLNK